MLVLLFKDEQRKEQMRDILDVLKPYAISCKFNQEDSFMLIFVYFSNTQEVVENLVKKGLVFLSEIRADEPFFVENFGEDDDTESIPVLSYESSSADYEPPENAERKPVCMYRPVSPPPPPPPMTPEVELKLEEQFKLQLEDFKKSISVENTKLKNEILNQISRVSFTPTASPITTPVSSANRMAVPQQQHQAIANTIFNTPQLPTASQNIRFAAKNELLANGLRCDMCQRTLKGEAIAGFLDALRHHALEHFNINFPPFKRFQCRECPGISTNFVNDIESHLKKHDSLTSLPDKRKRLVVQLMSPQYLKALADTCKKCFPDVFESEPMDIKTIELHSTPQKAKQEVFPLICREFCMKHNITDKRMSVRRAGNPVPLININ